MNFDIWLIQNESGSFWRPRGQGNVRPQWVDSPADAKHYNTEGRANGRLKVMKSLGIYNLEVVKFTATREIVMGAGGSSMQNKGE